MNEEGYALLQSKYVAEREKVAKLEGWLKYLWFTSQSEWVQLATKEQEISDYIKAMEGK